MGRLRHLPVLLTVAFAAAVGFALGGSTSGARRPLSSHSRAVALAAAGWPGDDAVLTARPDAELLGIGSLSGGAERLAPEASGSPRTAPRTGGRNVGSDRERQQAGAVPVGPVRLRSPPG